MRLFRIHRNSLFFIVSQFSDMNKTKYRTLLIDLDDTLWDTRANARESMSEIYIQYSLNRYFESFDAYYEIYTRRNLELWDLYHFGKITKQQLTRERFLYPLAQVGVEDEQMAANLGRDFLETTTTKTKLVDGAIELLDYLHPKYRLFILSNGFREVQYRKMENSGLTPYFEKVFLSEDAGVNKPHPEIYRYALKNSNSKKSETLMIGDNPDTDIAGAHSMKIDQIYFADNQVFDIGFKPTFIVNKLAEIMEIL